MKTRISICGLLSTFCLFQSLQLLAALPGISEHPVGQTVLTGSLLYLRVGATNGEPLYYQWFRRQIKLTSETNSTLVLSNVDLTAGGDYFVTVTNSFGRTTSSIAPVTVVRFLPDVDVTAVVGARVVLSVMINGRPVKIRWVKDDQALTSDYDLVHSYRDSPITLPSVVNSNAGQYCVIVSNQWGAVRPPCNALNVVAPGPLDALHSVGQLPRGQYYSLERHNGLFLALGGSRIVYSTNATNWSATAFQGQDFRDVVWGDGKYVAVGNNSEPYPGLFTSIDGSNWSPQTISAFGVLISVAYGAGNFVVAAQQEVFSSADGTNWTKVLPTGALDVVWGGGRFVLVSSLESSTNGLVWERSLTAPAGYLYSIAYGNGRFVAVGSDGLTMTSSDGISWTAHGSGTIEWFTKVAYGNGVFLGITRSSTLLSSPDGISWTIRARGTNSLIEAFNYIGLVCAANGTFLVGASNNVLLETDPFTMLQLSITPTPTLYLHGIVGRPHRIEGLDPSSPEMQWRILDTIIPDASPLIWVDPAPSARHRIYRATSP